MSTNIYFIRCGEFVKIGRGIDPEQRRRDLQTGNPYEIEIMGSFAATEAEELRLQDAFEQFHHRAEWYFLSNTLRAFITQHCRKAAVKLVGSPAPRRASRSEVTDEEVTANVKAFLEVRTEPKPDGRVRAGVVYEAYLSWCEQERRAATTFKRFGLIVNALGMRKDERNNRVFYLDLALRGMTEVAA